MAQCNESTESNSQANELDTSKPAAEEKATNTKPLNDFELANLFLGRIKLCRIGGIIHIFNGKYLYPLSSKDLEANIQSVLYDELVKIGNARKVKAVASIIERMPLETVNEAYNYLGFSNGVLDLLSWDFYEFPLNVSIPITYLLFAHYDFTMNNCIKFFNNSENWKYVASRNTTTADSFFGQIAGGDAILITRIYEMIGYILVPDTNAKAFFLLQGVPDSGKSVLGKFIESFFPMERVTALSISSIGGRFLPDNLSTSCLNLSMDLPDGLLSSSAVAKLKMLTGDDLVSHEVKYKDAKPYRGQCKFLFSLNGKLKMTSHDEAFLNRIVCIPFKNSLPKAMQDKHLLERLNAERGDIMMKALYFYRCLVSRNYQFSGEGNYKPDIEYKLAPNDTITEFVNEKCLLEEGQHTSTDALFSAYLTFCDENNYKANLSKSGFAHRLSHMYANRITPHRKHTTEKDNFRGYDGIGLYENQCDEYDDADYSDL